MACSLVPIPAYCRKLQDKRVTPVILIIDYDLAKYPYQELGGEVIDAADSYSQASYRMSTGRGRHL